MATQVTGSIGNQPVELNNAATENTLAQLLAVMQRVAPQQTRALQQIANSSGISPAAIQTAEAALKELGDSADRASNNMSSSMLRLPNLITPLFADLTSGLINTTKNLGDFAMAAINGTNTVAGLLRALESLPLGLGLVASLFRSIVEFNQPILDAFRNLSDVGQNTSNVFDSIRTSGTSLGLSISELENLMKQNSETFARMGVSAGQGADNFLNFAKNIKNSGIGERLLTLGYSFSSFNQGMLDFISITGGRTVEQMKDTDKLKASTTEYLFQLDKLSQLTGKSREEQAKQLKEASMNAAIQAKLMTLTPEQQTKYAVSLQNALMVGGKGAMDALKSEILGLAPVTEESRKFTALNAEAAASVRQMARDTIDSSKIIADINKSGATAVKVTSDRISAMGTPLVGALSMLNTANSETVMQMQNLTNLMRVKGLDSIKSIEDYLNARAVPDRRLVNELLEQEKQNLQIRQNLQTFMESLSRILTPAVTQGLATFVTAMGDGNNWENAGKNLANFMIQLGEFGANLFSEKGREKIADDISEQFKKIFDKVLDMITPDWWKSLRKSPYELGSPARKNFGISTYTLERSSAPAVPQNVAGTLVTTTTKSVTGQGNIEAAQSTEQASAVINSIMINNTKLIETMQAINLQNADMISALNSIAENTRKNVNATRNLDSNNFAR